MYMIFWLIAAVASSHGLAVVPAGETTPLSPYLKDLVQNLYETAERFRNNPGENSANAQIAAFEAINDLVRSSARDTLEFVGTLLQVRVRGCAGCKSSAWSSQPCEGVDFNTGTLCTVSGCARCHQWQRGGATVF